MTKKRDYFSRAIKSLLTWARVEVCASQGGNRPAAAHALDVIRLLRENDACPIQRQQLKYTVEPEDDESKDELLEKINESEGVSRICRVHERESV